MTRERATYFMARKIKWSRGARTPTNANIASFRLFVPVQGLLNQRATVRIMPSP
jgi:hypothetical protein